MCGIIGIYKFEVRSANSFCSLRLTATYKLAVLYRLHGDLQQGLR